MICLKKMCTPNLGLLDTATLLINVRVSDPNSNPLGFKIAIFKVIYEVIYSSSFIYLK